MRTHILVHTQTHTQYNTYGYEQVGANQRVRVRSQRRPAGKARSLFSL